MEADVRVGMLKVIGIIFAVFTALYLLALFIVPVATRNYEAAKHEQQVEQEREREKLLALSGMELVTMANQEEALSGDLIDEIDFKYPFGCTGNVIKVVGGFEEKQYVVTIPYADENYMLDRNVFGDLEPIADISYEYENKKGIITLTLNNMYEYTTDYDEERFRLILIEPKQIYKKIILIDAGGGETEEINRDIVLRLREKLKDEVECGIFYSGLEENESRSMAEDRISFASDISADYIISVQMNETASHKMSAINGTQVAYQPGKDQSVELAERFQQLLVDAIGSSDKGTMEISEEEIYKEVNACAVVIKPGFKTNKFDMEYMKAPENRQLIANTIYEGLLSIMRD